MDYLNPEAVAQQLVPQERLTKEDTTFDIHRRIHRGWIEKSIQYTWNGESCHHVERVQALTKSAFQSALSDAGLEVSHVWGDYALVQVDTRFAQDHDSRTQTHQPLTACF